MSSTCFDSCTVADTWNGAYMTVDGIGRHGLDLSDLEQGKMTGSLCERVEESSVSTKCKEFLN